MNRLYHAHLIILEPKRGAEQNQLPQIYLFLILKYPISNNVMLKFQKHLKEHLYVRDS